jgi:hypothetical protein
MEKVVVFGQLLKEQDNKFILMVLQQLAALVVHYHL